MNPIFLADILPSKKKILYLGERNLILRRMRTGPHGPLHCKYAGEMGPEQGSLALPAEQVAEMTRLISSGKAGTDF